MGSGRLITELAQIQPLKVISRTSIMQYKGARQPLPDIGRALHVDAIVQGSVRRSGERVAISVQLLRASTDAHIWADTYEEDMRGHVDLAFDWLDRAVEARSGMILWLPTAREYDQLRNHPRYQAVLQRIAAPLKGTGS